MNGVGGGAWPKVEPKGWECEAAGQVGEGSARIQLLFINNDFLNFISQVNPVVKTTIQLRHHIYVLTKYKS